MNKKIGEKIRQMRVLKGLSQENVAEEIGMSHGNFGKIERGEIEVNSTKLIEIAKVLKVSPADFFDEKPRQVKDLKPDYGFATKEDLMALSQLVQNLIREFERLRDEQPKKRKKTKKNYSDKD